jgi:hypothetical protein
VSWETVWAQVLRRAASSSLPAPIDSPSPACASPAYGQFDFWLGNWTVTVPSGGTAGSNRIHRISGCGVQENWTDAQSGGGVSLNMWDPRSEKWGQFYVASNGSAIELYGDGRPGEMVMDGNSGSVQERVTWSLLEDGRVRQHWQRSVNGGVFSTFFDGYYRRQ